MSDARPATNEPQRPAWLEDHYRVVENRPWANEKNRELNGCIGKDYIFHSPRLEMVFWWSDKAQKLAGTVKFLEGAEGPPKGAHGASVAAFFDECLAYPVWATGVTALTGSLTIKFRQMTPLHTTLRFEAYVAKAEGRRRHLYGKLSDVSGKSVIAEGSGLWFVTDKTSFHGHIQPMVPGQLPANL